MNLGYVRWYSNCRILKNEVEKLTNVKDRNFANTQDLFQENYYILVNKLNSNYNVAN